MIYGMVKSIVEMRTAIPIMIEGHDTAFNGF